MENVMENEEDFAKMFEQTYKEPTRMEPGQKVEAAIVNITPEWALIEVGGKGEGYIDINELKDAEGNLMIKIGDKVRAYFLHTEEGEMRFTTKIGTGPAARAQLMDAFKNHIPMEGKVSKELKGGFEIIISGGMRAFCPYSQMGIRRDENKEAYIGASMIFFIIECDRRDVVLSRREIVEKERQEKIVELKATLQEGHKIRGVVTSIQKFGAFVDIGGVEGLLPVSEMAWGRTEKVSDLLAPGQPVRTRAGLARGDAGHPVILGRRKVDRALERAGLGAGGASGRRWPRPRCPVPQAPRPGILAARGDSERLGDLARAFAHRPRPPPGPRMVAGQ